MSIQFLALFFVFALTLPTISSNPAVGRQISFQEHSLNDLDAWPAAFLRGALYFKIDLHYIWNEPKICEVQRSFGKKNCFLLNHNPPLPLEYAYNTTEDLIRFLSGLGLYFPSLTLQLCFKTPLDPCSNTTLSSHFVSDVEMLLASLFTLNHTLILDGIATPNIEKRPCLFDRFLPFNSTWILTSDPLGAGFSNDKQLGYDRYQVMNVPEALIYPSLYFEAMADKDWGKFIDSPSIPFQVWEPSFQQNLVSLGKVYIDTITSPTTHPSGLNFAINIDSARFAIYLADISQNAWNIRLDSLKGLRRPYIVPLPGNLTFLLCSFNPSSGLYYYRIISSLFPLNPKGVNVTDPILIPVTSNSSHAVIFSHASNNKYYNYKYNHNDHNNHNHDMILFATTNGGEYTLFGFNYSLVPIGSGVLPPLLGVQLFTLNHTYYLAHLSTAHDYKTPCTLHLRLFILLDDKFIPLENSSSCLLRYAPSPLLSAIFSLSTKPSTVISDSREIFIFTVDSHSTLRAQMFYLNTDTLTVMSPFDDVHDVSFTLGLATDIHSHISHHNGRDYLLLSNGGGSCTSNEKHRKSETVRLCQTPSESVPDIVIASIGSVADWVSYLSNCYLSKQMNQCILTSCSSAILSQSFDRGYCPSSFLTTTDSKLVIVSAIEGSVEPVDAGECGMAFPFDGILIDSTFFPTP